MTDATCRPPTDEAEKKKKARDFVRGLTSARHRDLLKDQHFEPVRCLTWLLETRRNPSVEERAYLMGLSVEEARKTPALARLLDQEGVSVKDVLTGIKRFAAGGKLSIDWPEGWLLIDSGLARRLLEASVGEWLPWAKGSVYRGWGGPADDLTWAEADETVAEVLTRLWQECEQERKTYRALVAKIID